MIRVNHKRALALCLASLLTATGALAQKQGSNVKIHTGTVIKAEQTTIQSDGKTGAGVLVGGAVGYALTSSSASTSRKRRNTVLGAVVGGAAGSSARKSIPATQYTVALANGSQLAIVTDQTEIKVGDCVVIEEGRDAANIRRASATTCEPESQPAVEALAEEMQEEADECTAAKRELLDADSTTSVDLAMRKVEILCND